MNGQAVGDRLTHSRLGKVEDCRGRRLSVKQALRQTSRKAVLQASENADRHTGGQVSSCLKAGCRTGVLYKMACMGMSSSLQYIFFSCSTVVTVHGKSVENAYLF